MPADSDYQTGWEHDQASRSRIGLIVAMIVGMFMLGAFGLVVLANRSAKTPEKIAAVDPPLSGPRVSASANRTTPHRNAVIPPSQVSPMVEAMPAEDKPPANPYAPRTDRQEIAARSDASQVCRARTGKSAAASSATISAKELEQDHKTILQYVKATMSQTGLRELQWKGPWLAQSAGSSKKGRLYRLRATKKDIGSDFKTHDFLVELLPSFTMMRWSNRRKTQATWTRYQFAKSSIRNRSFPKILQPRK